AQWRARRRLDRGAKTGNGVDGTRRHQAGGPDNTGREALMSMAAGGSGGQLSNEPNVTPMIDVLLVLLIIFMAVLPSMRKAIDIQLPDPHPQVAAANQANNQIVLEVLPGDQFKINSAPYTRTELGPKLTEIYHDR